MRVSFIGAVFTIGISCTAAAAAEMVTEARQSTVPAHGSPVSLPGASSEGPRSSSANPGLTSVRAQVRQCVKLCPSDYSPCDPIIYKIADGRCKTSRNQ